MSTQPLPIAHTQFKSANLSNSLPSSLATYFRFRSDFELPQTLGRGAYAQVFRARNRLDGQLYAIKRIKLSRENCSLNNKILREVFTLSSLTHPNIVRYYQSWIEDYDSFNEDLEESDSEDFTDSEDGDHEEEYELDQSFDSSEWDPLNPLDKIGHKTISNSNNTKPCHGCKYHQNSISHNSSLPRCLYIQMEFCPVTLKDVLLDHTLWKRSQNDIWNLFRQILEALEYLHSLDIVHRDLKPDNIFFGRSKSKDFDVLKIGDFGLATSLKETSSKSCVGTYLYTSPEYNDVEQGPSNEKVDIFACGIILFELWYPFTTAMERIETLDALRNDMKFPAGFGEGVCDEKGLVVSLVKKMLHQVPTERPSAQDLIRQLPAHEKELNDSVLELRRRLEKANKKIESLEKKNSAQRAQISLLTFRSKNKKIRVRGPKSR